MEAAKRACEITKLNNEMTDDDIRKVMRWIGEGAPDTVWIDEKPILSKLGIGMMLFLSLSEFPEFYIRYGLSQFN